MRIDNPEIKKEVNFDTITAASASNNSIFRDSIDDIIKTKDNAGEVKFINGSLVIFDSDVTMTSSIFDINITNTTCNRLKIYLTIKTIIGSAPVPRFLVNNLAVGNYLLNYMDLDSTPAFISNTYYMTDSQRGMGLEATIVVDMWISNGKIYSNYTIANDSTGMTVGGAVTNSGTHTAITALKMEGNVNYVDNVVNLKIIGYKD